MLWHSSNELLKYALRELRATLQSSNSQKIVKIILTNDIKACDENEIRQTVERLKIKDITKELRKEFAAYNLESKVIYGESFRDYNTVRADSFYYPLVWVIKLK